MTARDFCFFMKGFLEMTSANKEDETKMRISSEQVQIIRAKLAEVEEFKTYTSGTVWNYPVGVTSTTNLDV